MFFSPHVEVERQPGIFLESSWSCGSNETPRSLWARCQKAQGAFQYLLLGGSWRLLKNGHWLSDHESSSFFGLKLFLRLKIPTAWLSEPFGPRGTSFDQQAESVPIFLCGVACWYGVISSLVAFSDCELRNFEGSHSNRKTMRNPKISLVVSLLQRGASKTSIMKDLHTARYLSSP